MKLLTLIVVGKLRSEAFSKIEDEYFKRIKKIKYQVIEIKSLNGDKNAEASLALKKIDSLKIKPDKIFAMTERGLQLDSPTFSKLIFDYFEGGFAHLLFIMGGASGHGKKILDRADQEISLSSLTFPHQMARVIFIEQLYRAQCLHDGHPYHK